MKHSLLTVSLLTAFMHLSTAQAASTSQVCGMWNGSTQITIELNEQDSNSLREYIEKSPYSGTDVSVSVGNLVLKRYADNAPAPEILLNSAADFQVNVLTSTRTISSCDSANNCVFHALYIQFLIKTRGATVIDDVFSCTFAKPKANKLILNVLE